MGDLLKDKVGIVTGSGRGIGRGVAMLMAAEGAKMVVNDLGGAVDGSGNSSSPADDVVDEIKAAGGDAVANYDSVSTMEGGENIVKTAIDNFGKLDIVVTPAGILRDRMVFNMTEQEWDDVIAVHLKGTFTVTKFACILFRQQRSGNIITFSSTSGLYGNSGQANYGAAKDGIAGYTRAIARDMGRYGVRVNSISPGANSRMTATVPQSARDIRASSGISGAARQQPKLELRREPEDIAPFVTWLASDKADGVNGQVFHVTGGEVSLMNNPEVARTITTQG
ncbi:MAG TPA: SDR family oxidoreductase, partial [Dehalococcoidia bacterium]|nr:SDR family oxidoreductase [Dehalococcoidia bacterium]